MTDAPPLPFVRRSPMPVSAESLYRWHERPGAFERLTPPWESVRVAARTAADGRASEAGGIEDGSRVVLRLGAGPLAPRWVAEHRDVRPGRSFRDVQVAGPFALWEHEHRMVPDGPESSFLEDRVTWAPPGRALGRAVAGPIVVSRLERLFTWRHATTRGDLERHAGAERSGPMRILVTGASGLVGSALVAFLTTGGHEVVRAVRRPARTGELTWEPAAGLDPALLRGFDAIVHLAGENIAGARWNDEVKRRILESRVAGTAAVARAAAAATPRPSVLVVASAAGYYGAGGGPADESAPAGSGFLADVCRAWEEAAQPARDAGIRVVHLRFGVVLSPAGGALRRMLLPFRLGLGGVLGSGDQGFPWISIDDAVGVVHQALTDPRLDGPVNAVAPELATNRSFTRTLGRVLGRPTVLPMPAFAARLAFGEMADHLLLAGRQLVPARLAAAGFRWRQPTLEAALRHVLGR